MTALQAASAGVKDMADGSLRITIEFEPRYAKDAFALFGARGTQVAIAALKDGSFLEQPVDGYPEYTQNIPDKYPEVTQNIPRTQLGDACYRTVMWCNEPSFWEFINTAGFTNDAAVLFVDSVITAADAVKNICDVVSRKELDTNLEANKIWNREIRQPYADYLKRLEAT